jgi:hypothetical protein
MLARLLPACLFPTLLTAVEITVTPDPTTGAKPIATAVARAASGDVLVLQPGVYRERIQLEKPLIIRGQPGAVLDGSAPLQAGWAEAGGDLAGVFTAPAKSRPRGLLVDGKFVAEIRFDRAQEKGEWHWRTLLRQGPPLSGYREIRALWMYQPEEKRIYARFPEAAGPDRLAVSLVPEREPLLRIAKTKGAIVEGLTFTRASHGVVLGEGATECTIRRCRIESYEAAGIVLTDGAAQCVVEECEITRGSLEDWTPSLEHNRANYEIWRIHKDVGNYDRNGIVLEGSGAGNRILRNHLDRVFDGVALGDSSAESLDKPLPNPEHGRGTEIAGNIIENTRDSGLELGVGCIDVNVHHNVLRRTHGGLRFKLPRLGPLFIHHNRLIDGAPFAIWFSMDASPAEAYVYHNTIVRGGSTVLQVARDSMKRDFIAPHWHFVNNLVLSDRGFAEPSGKPPWDFSLSHNVTTGKLRPWPNDPAKDPGSLYAVAVTHDAEGSPAAKSAALDTGIDLSTYFHGKPLPGCEPGYFRGKAPDAGADEVEAK